MKGKVPGVGLTPVDKTDKDHVSQALSIAQTSTASMGKFDESLPKEKFENQREKKKSLNRIIQTCVARSNVHLTFFTSYRATSHCLMPTNPTFTQF